MPPMYLLHLNNLTIITTTTPTALPLGFVKSVPVLVITSTYAGLHLYMMISSWHKYLLDGFSSLSIYPTSR